MYAPVLELHEFVRLTRAACPLHHRRLPVADRLTMVPLLGALLDYDSDPDTYAQYDAMTARELFRQYGASR